MILGLAVWEMSVRFLPGISGERAKEEDLQCEQNGDMANAIHTEGGLSPWGREGLGLGISRCGLLRAWEMKR